MATRTSSEKTDERTAERTERLRRIFTAVTGDATPTFVERQQARRGRIPSESEVDDDLAAVVTRMRERYAFTTDLDDATLVRVVRGFYADRSDAALAETLDTDPDTVVAARIDLHLLRDEDATPPAGADADALRERFEAGADDATVAQDLGADVSAVRRYRRVLDTAREAVSVNHRFQTDFESVLATSDLDDALRANLAGDRRVFDAVKY
ncbi:conditioned medium-induced protein 4 [Halobium salinum]|uniref:Conditioned medium-induced protein 4 n=1 Tax=Halobium salinum TaxID=1364940 RepID=A0ABD5PDK3_9EURY|nr:conditioned medium-induced protein 4 [Halobium salinum]